MRQTYLTIRSLLAPLKFCLEVTAPTTKLPMPIRRRVSGVLAKGTCGRSDFDLDLGRVGATGTLRGGRLRGGMGIGLSAFCREGGLEYSPQPGAVANSLGAQISITVVLLNLCAAPIANVA